MPVIHRPGIDLRYPRLLGAVGMVLLSLAAVMAWRAGDAWVSLLYAVLASLGLYLFLGSGQVTADGDVVTVTSRLGRYQLAWHAVRRVERSAHGTLVLHGADARLVLPPPLLWSGPHKQALRELVAREIRARSLPVEPSRFADYRTHRNVRLKPPLRG